MTKAGEYAKKGAIVGAVLAGVIALAVSGVGAMLWAALVFGAAGAIAGGLMGSASSDNNIGYDAQYLQQKYSDQQVLAKQEEHQQKMDRRLENADEYRTSITSRYWTEKVPEGHDDWGDRSR